LDETTKGIEMMLHFRQGEEHVYAFSTVADPHLVTSGMKAGSRFARALNLPLRLEKRYDGLGINDDFEQRRKI
jgi:hypothetical protein